MIARVLVLLVLASRIAAADDGEAERLYKEGQAAYDDKRYAEAIVAWDKAYRLSKLPALKFNLAQAQRLAGNCRPAYAAYREFIQLDPKAEDRPAAEQFMRELESCANPKQNVDRPKPLYEDQGRGKRIGGMAFAGAGFAAIAAGIYFGNRATTIANEIKSACAAGCEWATLESKDSEGRRAETLQYVLLGTGAAVVATGVWFYVRGTRARNVLVEPRANGGMLKVGGRF